MSTLYVSSSRLSSFLSLLCAFLCALSFHVSQGYTNEQEEEIIPSLSEQLIDTFCSHMELSFANNFEESLENSLTASAAAGLRYQRETSLLGFGAELATETKNLRTIFNQTLANMLNREIYTLEIFIHENKTGEARDMTSLFPLIEQRATLYLFDCSCSANEIKEVAPSKTSSKTYTHISSKEKIPLGYEGVTYRFVDAENRVYLCGFRISREDSCLDLAHTLLFFGSDDELSDRATEMREIIALCLPSN